MTVIYIILTLLILTVLVVSHEFGHFIMAKKHGVTVLEFAIGMGPALYRRQGKETLFTIRALPIGGFCRMLGEEEDDEDAEDGQSLRDTGNENSASDAVITEKVPAQGEELDPGDFRAKSKAQRFSILAAGPVMNFILGFVILLICYFLLGANPIQAVTAAFRAFGTFASAVFESLKMLFTGEVGVNDLAGPIGMVSMVGEVYAYGFVTLLSFAAFLSINLGLMNLLPIPALDGGQMLIIICEAIYGKNLSAKVKGILIGASFVFLIGLMLFVAVNDVMRIVG